ncbi:DUF1289 domain-containing protein [Piscinibacter sakaiensis]|uniref:YbaK/prolyl-tRNA synthetase associated region n=1 Tax=Piscinibacter sakaiensis TaxID=1547922 RepID=A0A0K8NZM6_PISS1|nr:YbaK/prolyl-tRNA synthetase associated region [Piscinibacter sakaiensis]
MPAPPVPPARRPVSDGPPTGPGPVPSPCIDVCRMDPATGWCLGCRRTIDEIAAWSRMDDAARRRVWALLPDRRPAGA